MMDRWMMDGWMEGGRKNGGWYITIDRRSKKNRTINE